MQHTRKLNQKSNAIIPFFVSFNFISFFLHIVAPLIFVRFFVGNDDYDVVVVAVYAPYELPNRVHGRLHSMGFLCVSVCAERKVKCKNLIKIRAGIFFIFQSRCTRCCRGSVYSVEKSLELKEKLHYLFTQKKI